MEVMSWYSPGHFFFLCVPSFSVCSAITKVACEDQKLTNDSKIYYVENVYPFGVYSSLEHASCVNTRQQNLSEAAQ
jgi:hypothetical protein